MSSICTPTPSELPSRPEGPASGAPPAIPSASLRAAQTHSTLAWLATDASPDTMPPPPRCADNCPSSPTANDTGPRVGAVSTCSPADLELISGHVIWPSWAGPGGPGPLRVRGRAGPVHRRPGQTRCGQPGTIQLEWPSQLNTAHPEGWRDRPCEAPATITVRHARAERGSG